MMENCKFYERKRLTIKDIVDLTGIWESYAGESFTDYCSFSRKSDKNFLKFLEEEYPVLYNYHKEVADSDDLLDNTIQYIIFSVENYVTKWVPDGKFPLYNLQLKLAMYPLAEFILKDDIAWQEFENFFINAMEDYNIREDFEDGRKL